MMFFLMNRRRFELEIVPFIMSEAAGKDPVYVKYLSEVRTADGKVFRCVGSVDAVRGHSRSSQIMIGRDFKISRDEFLMLTSVFDVVQFEA